MAKTTDNITVGADLPTLNESLLDRDTLSRLFRDIASCTQVLEVVVKHKPTDYVGSGRIGLEDACRLIEERAVRGVQVRYFYDGTQWWDTLMVLSPGVRLVRIQHDPEQWFTEERPTSS